MKRRLLILGNVGTPDDPSVPAVRRYLRQFLMDPRVIRAPFFIRWLLVNGWISSFRAPKSAAKYSKIWTQEGSPLLVHSKALAQALSANGEVRLAMRYGQPSVSEALHDAHQFEEILLAPLYPQRAGATTQSLEEEFWRSLSPNWQGRVLSLRPFYEAPEFVSAVAKQCRNVPEPVDHWLFSFHGLPLRDANEWKWREQCEATAKAVAREIGAQEFSISYQSRLGPVEWIGPSTEETFQRLGKLNLRLAVVAPSFVSDCLETLEELAIEGEKTFLAAGGRSFQYVPCVNETWASGLSSLVREGSNYVVAISPSPRFR